MVVSYRQSPELAFVVFRELKVYPERELRRKLEDRIAGLNDDDFKIIKDFFDDDSDIRHDGSSYTFKFVGGMARKLRLRDDAAPVNLAIFVYPKWHNPASDQEFETIENLMTGFGKYFSGLTSNRESNAERMSNLDHNDPSQINNNSSHIFTTWLSLINDTNTHGYILERQRIENSRTGRPNWNSTFSKTTPIMINGTPHYLNPIRELSSNSETIVTKIHEEIYGYVMTQLSHYFPMKKRMNFRTINDLSNINQKKTVLRDAINKCSRLFIKERLEILLSVIERSTEFNPNMDIRFGITSRGMDYFWEAMLLQTVGSKAILDEIQREIPSVEITAGGSTRASNSRRSKHKMDGVLRMDSDPLNQGIILYDAKHYREWNALSIEDVTKQYAYERAIALNPSIAYTVQKNCFVFPMTDIGNSISSIIVNRGTYDLPYLSGSASTGISIPELQIIELNPYMVLESYSKGVEYNLGDELRGALN